MGQTGRGFLKRFIEHRPPTHFHSLDSVKSKFAEHLISENHSYTNFKTNLKPLHICKKGRYLNALEEYEIYKAHNNIGTKPHVLNDKLAFKSNVLYNTALRYCRGGSET